MSSKTLASMDPGDSRYRPECTEAIETLRTCNEGDEVTITTWLTPLSGRIEEIDDTNPATWVHLKPIDLQQVRDCFEFDSLETLDLVVFAEAGEDEYTVQAILYHDTGDESTIGLPLGLVDDVA